MQLWEFMGLTAIEKMLQGLCNYDEIEQSSSHSILYVSYYI